MEIIANNTTVFVSLIETTTIKELFEYPTYEVKLAFPNFTASELISSVTGYNGNDVSTLGDDLIGSLTVTDSTCIDIDVYADSEAEEDEEDSDLTVTVTDRDGNTREFGASFETTLREFADMLKAKGIDYVRIENFDGKELSANSRVYAVELEEYTFSDCDPDYGTVVTIAGVFTSTATSGETEASTYSEPAKGTEGEVYVRYGMGDRTATFMIKHKETKLKDIVLSERMLNLRGINESQARGMAYAINDVKDQSLDSYLAIGDVIDAEPRAAGKNG